MEKGVFSAEMEVCLHSNKEQQKMEITDSGVGMTHYNIINTLCSITNSCSAAFLEKDAEAKCGSNIIE